MQQGGINELVNQKADAYRGNPQALEKRYQQNQQLLDLLALQKVKSDKEAAARDMQLKMDQNPNTIAQQREQEVLAMTKDDMSKQVSGILGQRQKQQQKNMQRTAKGQGIPAAQPPQMAAQGGIMGYAHGGEHNDEDADEGGMIDFLTENAAGLISGGIIAVDQLKEAKKSGGLGNLARSAIGKLKNLKNLPGAAGKIGDIAAKAANLFTRAGPRKTPPARSPTASARDPRAVSVVQGSRELSPTKIGAAGLGLAGAGKAIDALTDETSTDPIPTTVTGTRKKVEEKKKDPPVNPLEERRLDIQRQKDELIAQGKDFDPRADISGTSIFDRNKEAGINTILQKQISQDPKALANQERDDFYQDSDRTGVASTLQRRIDDIEAYDAKRYDPARIEREAAKRAYEAMGVAGAGSAGINAARNSYTDSAENAQRNSLVQYFNLEQSKIGTDLAIVNKGNELKAKIWGTLATERSNAMSILSSVNVADVQNATALAKEARQANDAQIDRKLTSLRDDSADRRAEIMANIENRKIDVNLYRDLMALEADIKASLATDERFMNGQAAMAKRAADPEAELTREEMNDAMYAVVQLEEAKAKVMYTNITDGLSGQILSDAKQGQDQGEVEDNDGDIATAVAAMQAAAGD